MPTAQSPGARGPIKSAGIRRMFEPIPFNSTCPYCSREQHQRGFARATLQRLLWHGLPIEGYCVACDQFWSISAEERTALSKVLGPSGE